MSRMLKWREILRNSQQGKAAEPFLYSFLIKFPGIHLKCTPVLIPVFHIKRIFSFFLKKRLGSIIRKNAKGM